MSEQGKKRDNRLTVRLSDDLFDTVKTVANEFNISNSDVIRYALTNNLREVSALKRKRMTIEEREDIINAYLDLVKNVNNFSNLNKRVGTSLNQLVKNLNKNPNLSATQINNLIEKVQILNIQKYQEVADNHIEILRKELNEIWQLLQ